MTIENTPNVTTLAPIINQVREIAHEELPEPQACKVHLWDDGDYDIWVYHKTGPNSREQVVYNRETGEIVWQYRKLDPDWEFPDPDEIPDGEERVVTPEFIEKEDRTITTIKAPTRK